MSDILTWLKENYNLDSNTLKNGIPRELRDIIDTMRKDIDFLKSELSFYKTAIDSMQHPIFIKNSDLKFVFLNERYKSFFYTNKDSSDNNIQDSHHGSEDEREQYQKEDTHLLKTKSTIKSERIFKGDDSVAKESSYWSKGFVVPETGDCGIIGEIIDISHEKRLQRDLNRQAKVLEHFIKESMEQSRIDETTNVFNRRIIKDKIPDLLDEAVRMNIPICGALCDIDDFRKINEKYGQETGDKILLQFADAMRATLREGDLIMRYGGDEFAVMLVGVNIDEAQHISRRFLDSFNKSIANDGIPITVSIGITKFKFGEDIFTFLSRLDESLYTAKNSGKNKTVVL